jgi:hypothetical protein
VEALVVGRRAVALILLFGLIATACASRAAEPGTASGDQTAGANGDSVSVAVSVNQATNVNVVESSTTIQIGSVGSAQNVVIGTSGGSAVVAGDQMANGVDGAAGVDGISVTGASVSVVSNVSAGSSVSVTGSASSADGSSVVNVSVTTGSGSVSRTVRFDKAGRFVLRVTADGDGVPVIQVEEVGP